MQLDELLLLMLFCLHLLVLDVSHYRFCVKKNVTYVPTDVRKVSSTHGFRKATFHYNGCIRGTGVRAIRISLQICTHASWGRGAFDWTPCILPFPVLEFSVERGCLTSPERPNRIVT